MSIFKKKGTVESLFRMGEGAEGGKGPAAEPEGIKKHEVYYVRGRPFIAPAKTGAPRLAQCTVGIAHRQVQIGACTSVQSWSPGREGGVGIVSASLDGEEEKCVEEAV